MSLPSIFRTCPILIIAIPSLWSARAAVIRLVGATLMEQVDEGAVQQYFAI
jgi:hypothetical protein